mmetsp:Transcript_33782/g.87812  ORF Transcript_33782/g.87812 Transcript_33782/m.87812 type:complete len:238 (+) Transcript_33782:42-755(+)
MLAPPHNLATSGAQPRFLLGRRSRRWGQFSVGGVSDVLRQILQGPAKGPSLRQLTWRRPQPGQPCLTLCSRAPHVPERRKRRGSGCLLVSQLPRCGGDSLGCYVGIPLGWGHIQHAGPRNALRVIVLHVKKIGHQEEPGLPVGHGPGEELFHVVAGVRRVGDYNVVVWYSTHTHSLVKIFPAVDHAPKPDLRHPSHCATLRKIRVVDAQVLAGLAQALRQLEQEPFDVLVGDHWGLH